MLLIKYAIALANGRVIGTGNLLSARRTKLGNDSSRRNRRKCSSSLR